MITVMTEQGLTAYAQPRSAFQHVAEVQNDGEVEANHTIEFYDSIGQKCRKTSTTVTKVNNEWYGRINHMDETNGGAAAQGFARVDSENAVCVLGVEEEDKYIVLKEPIIIDSITWNQRTGQTSVFNAHLAVLQLEINGTIIEASSHYVGSDGAGESIKTLGSGAGVLVAAGSTICIATGGAGTLAAGDDVYGYEWKIVYRRP